MPGDAVQERVRWNGAQPGALQEPHQEFQGEAEGVRPGKTSEDLGARWIDQRCVVAVDDAQKADLAQGNRPSVARRAAGEENDRRGGAGRLRARPITNELAFCGEDTADVGKLRSFLEGRRCETLVERNEGQLTLHAGDEGRRELRTIRERHSQSVARTKALGAESGDQPLGKIAWVA